MPLPWTKIAWKTRDTIVSGVTWLLLDRIEEMNGTPSDDQGDPADYWMKFQYRISDIVSQDTADDQVVSFNVVNHTNGIIDPTWNDDDFGWVEAALTGIFLDTADRYSGRLTLTDVKAYAQSFNAIPPEGGIPNGYNDIVASGGPLWARTLNVPFVGASNMAPQVCSSVTEETPSRRHWGRFYLPTLAAGALANGRVGTGTVDALANATSNAYNELFASDFQPVVVSTRANKGKVVHALQGVTGVRCDDVPDIIRRRRFKNALYHKILPVA